MSYSRTQHSDAGEAQTQTNVIMTCPHSKDSDQAGHPPSLISVFADLMKKVFDIHHP